MDWMLFTLPFSVDVSAMMYLRVADGVDYAHIVHSSYAALYACGITPIHPTHLLQINATPTPMPSLPATG